MEPNPIPPHDHTRTYLRVFIALLVLTVLEYLYARLFSDRGFTMLVTGLVGLAAIKAILVGLFFMHLVFEGRWKYLILMPTAFLVIVLVSGLYPDMGLDAKRFGPDRAALSTNDLDATP